jgi:fatty acid synthase subunit alpha
MALVGGTDDFREEASYEFGSMQATVNTDEEVLQGRSPSEMCRPSTTTRNGFMEAAGCGVQIITTAEMALKMGLPIYAIVAHTQMASDRIGRSIPAPGQGILTAAREAPDAAKSPLLDLEYRREKLNEALHEIDIWRTRQLQLAKTMPADDIDGMLQSLDRLRDCKASDARNLWGSNFRQQNPEIAPIRAALAVWGLTVDDIGVASLHGTSTKANDKNEANVINQQMTKLGRTAGNPLLTISQKWLTGHPKGAAGAWMFNGGMQVLQTGIVPGNRNADNIDVVLEPFEHLIYPSKSIQTSGIKAFMLTSFGFGQKGGIAIGISPKFVFAAITEEEYQQYRETVQLRQRKAELSFIRALMTKSHFKPKTESPWKNNENTVLLDPRARAFWHSEMSEYIVTV